ncbi:MAG: hypothetical protein ACTHQQ_22220 [Solirubrobacteraceae bacterium]
MRNTKARGAAGRFRLKRLEQIVYERQAVRRAAQEGHVQIPRGGDRQLPGSSSRGGKSSGGSRSRQSSGTGSGGTGAQKAAAGRKGEKKSS